jgi:hypothetical protein
MAFNYSRHCCERKRDAKQSRCSRQRGVYVEGLSEEAVISPDDVLQIMDIGEGMPCRPDRLANWTASRLPAH